MSGGPVAEAHWVTCKFAAAQGWDWIDEGKDGRHKYGYVTEEANHDIIFVVSRTAVHHTVMPKVSRFQSSSLSFEGALCIILHHSPHMFAFQLRKWTYR